MSTAPRKPDLSKPTKSDIRKWCNALRSGEYKQGRRSLLRDGKYCCMGVACVINGAEIDEIRHQEIPSGRFEWIDRIDSEMGIFDYNLIQLNDTHGYSFDEIADLLELVYIHEMLGKQTID